MKEVFFLKCCLFSQVGKKGYLSLQLSIFMILFASLIININEPIYKY